MSSRAWHRSVLAAGFAAALVLPVLLFGSCSDDGADGGSTTTESAQPDSSTATSAPPESTSQPPASDTSAIGPIVDALLHQWDVAYTDALTDPAAVIADPDHEVREEFEALFTEDSPYLADLDLLVGSFADEDLRIEPNGSATAQATRFLRVTTVHSNDELDFVWCSFDDSAQVTASTGAVVSDEVGITEGTGTAVRVDGSWRLHRLQVLTHDVLPAGSEDPCPGRAEASQGAA